MQEDINNFSKKMDTLMTNIGNYLDNNMLIIESIEFVYMQRANNLKEFISKYISCLGKISSKFLKFKGNKLFLDEYIKIISSRQKIANDAFHVINRYILNDGIESELYHQYNAKFFKTTLAYIFSEILGIEKRDSNIAKSLIYKTSKYSSISIPNDFYYKCLAMVACGSCEYIETFAKERLAKLAHEILNITYESINIRYEKMMKEVSEYFQKGKEPIILNFKTDEDLNLILSIEGKGYWNPCQVITNQIFIKNTEFKKSFSSSLNEEASLIGRSGLEISMSESIKNENFEINSISMYLKTFQNDLKNEIIRHGYIYAFEIISLNTITNPLAILDTKVDSNKIIEKKTSIFNLNNNLQRQLKRNFSSTSNLNVSDNSMTLEDVISLKYDKSLPMKINVDEYNYKTGNVDQPNDNEKIESEPILDLTNHQQRLNSLLSKNKIKVENQSKEKFYISKNNKQVIEESETYDTMSGSFEEENVYENAVDLLSKSSTMEYNSSYSNKSELSKIIKQSIENEETAGKLTEDENKSKENKKMAEIIEDLEEQNFKLPNNLVIGKTYKILKKYFNLNSGVDESSFIEGDPCELLGVVDKTNFCMVKLLRLNKDVCVPMDYIVEKNIPPKIESKKLKVLPMIPKKSTDVEGKEKQVLKQMNEMDEDAYE